MISIKSNLLAACEDCQKKYNNSWPDNWADLCHPCVLKRQEARLEDLKNQVIDQEKRIVKLKAFIEEKKLG
jgi:hypothetical protein